MLDRSETAPARRRARTALPLVVLLAALTACESGADRPSAAESAPAAASGGVAAPASAEHARWTVYLTFGRPLRAPALQAYLNGFGLALAQELGVAGQVRKVEVLDSPRAEVLSLADGTVFVTRGLLALIEDEDELAAVLAHEIAHLSLDHRRSRELALAQSATSIGLRPSARPGIWVCDADCRPRMKPTLSGLYATWSGQELEADGWVRERLGATGRSPGAGLDVLERVQAYRGLAEAQGTVSQPGAAYGVHPGEAERIAARAPNAAARPSASGGGRDLGYLQAIEGLAYGGSGDAPYLGGRTYVNPKSGFGFHWPAGYRVQVDGNRSFAQGPGDVRLAFRGPMRLLSDPEEAVRTEWLEQENVVQVIQETQGGYPMLRGTVQQHGTDRLFRFVLAVRPGDLWGRGFAFYGHVPGAAPESLDPVLDEVMGSLRLFEPGGHSRALRIALVEVRPGDSQASLAARTALRDGRELERFRILNGLAPGEEPTPGQVVKMVAADAP